MSMSHTPGVRSRAADLAARQVAQLAQVALALSAAETVSDVEEVVQRGGRHLLGSSGSGSIVTRADGGGWQAALSEGLHDQVGDRFAVIPADSPLPSARVATTGEPLFLPNREAQLAYDPVMSEVYDAIGDQEAWAVLPLRADGQTIGALAMGWYEERHLTASELEVLEAFSAQCAQAVQRLQALDAQRRTERRFHEFSDAFQGAMLTAPPDLESLDIEVRYRPAVDVGHVGGDWYDSFQQPDGSTVLIIGDVAGHDVVAAGKMVQMRGVLRALAYEPSCCGPTWSPAGVLSRFEDAAAALGVEELAAVLVARVEPEGPNGSCRVQWSNAGGPPPILVHADGSTSLPEEQGDLLLGVLTGTDRHDHELELLPGARLLLYTDGLVERRGATLDQGIAALRSALVELAGAALVDLCDQVLVRLAPLTGEDDIAMIAAQVTPAA